MLNYEYVSNYTNNMIIEKSLDEATYYGKNESLLKCEELLNKALKISHKNIMANDTFINYIDQVGDILAKMFGFDEIQINHSIAIAHPTLLLQLAENAGCTLTHSVIYKYIRVVTGQNNTYVIDLDKDHKGVQFDPNVKYRMRMFLGMELFINNTQPLTGGEILAIILHEIGHNFYIGPIRELSAEYFAMQTADDVAIYFKNLMIQTFFIEGTDIIDRFQPESWKTVEKKIFYALSSFIAPFMDISRLYATITQFFVVIAAITKKLINIPNLMVNGFIKYDSEKYSDAFATAYGYGPELSSALNKITKLKVLDLMPSTTKTFYDWMIMFYKIPSSFLLTATDQHPNTQGRLANDIKYMRAAEKNITSPKIRKEYEQTLKEMEDLRQQIKDYKGPELSKNVDKFRSILQDFTHISDIKDITSSLKPSIMPYINLDK